MLSGLFGFLRSGGFTLPELSSPPSILSSDLEVDCHQNPTSVPVHLRHVTSDRFHSGVSIYVGKTGTFLCPVSALLNFMAVRPQGKGPVFVHKDGSPLTQSHFTQLTKHAFCLANFDATRYSGHSFRIKAATATAAAGVLAYFIKILGCWQSEAYHAYIHTARESLASVSQLLA